MSEQDKSQQTEEATPKRKEDMRKDGKVAQSQDVVAAGALALSCMAVGWSLSGGAARLVTIARRSFRLRDAHDPLQALGPLLDAFVAVAVPVLFAASIGAVVIGLTQTKLLFNLSNLAPKAERFAPLSQLKKIMPGKESGLEILKQVLKLGAIGLIVWMVLRNELAMLVGLAALPLPAIAEATMGVGARVVKWAVLAFVVVASFDYLMQKRKFDEESKMSKQDIRDEMKQDQGDPMVKRRQRQFMRELISQGGGSIAEATVLVTNPTHLSVALRYDPEKDAAPIVIAKAADDAALEMRREARKHGVPIVENKPFARAMYKDAKVGATLPAELFGPAAEVIAHVLGLTGRGATRAHEEETR